MVTEQKILNLRLHRPFGPTLMLKWVDYNSKYILITFLPTCDHHADYFKMADIAFLPIWRPRFLKNLSFKMNIKFSALINQTYTHTITWDLTIFKSIHPQSTFLVNLMNKKSTKFLLAYKINIFVYLWIYFLLENCTKPKAQ